MQLKTFEKGINPWRQISRSLGILFDRVIKLDLETILLGEQLFWNWWKVICHRSLVLMTLHYHKLFLIQASGKRFKWTLRRNSANLVADI